MRIGLADAGQVAVDELLDRVARRQAQQLHAAQRELFDHALMTVDVDHRVAKALADNLRINGHRSTLPHVTAAPTVGVTLGRVAGNRSRRTDCTGVRPTSSHPWDRAPDAGRG